MAEKQPKTMRRVKLSEIAEKPPEPEEIEDDAFFTGEEQEKAEESEKKGKIPPILKELWSIEDKKQIFKAFGKLLKRLLKGILPGNFFLKATIGRETRRQQAICSVWQGFWLRNSVMLYR